MYSRAELADHFRHLGVRPGDLVMAHASVRAFGRIAGGPDQVHLALGDALGESGTLMMYASCPDHYDEIGLGTLSDEDERDLAEKLSVFDARTAKSQRDNGALVEFFRTSPDVLVNDHVVRFAARGGRAAELLQGQPWNYAYGRGSALERFVRARGRILLLGCDHDTVTFLHYAEHIARLADRRVVRYKVPVLENGARVLREVEEFYTGDEGAHANWPPRFFARIVDTHLARSGNEGGHVGNAECFVIEADALLAFALEVMEAVALDPDAADRLLRL